MIGTALERGARLLAAASDSPRLDAELLLAHVLGVDRARLAATDDRPLAPAEVAAYDALLARRTAGEPVAYLLGRRDFWTLTLEVGPAVLVPRPETELVVEIALAALAGRPAPAVLDLGTGSGAIGLAIAAERADASVDLVDASPAALAVAERNRARLGLGNVRVLAGDWFAAVPGRRYHLVTANPPYLASDDPHLAAGELRHEPSAALIAGPSGLESLAAIAAAAPAHLLPGGRLVVEHGTAQGAAVRALLAAAGLRDVASHADLAGHERATAGTRRD